MTSRNFQSGQNVDVDQVAERLTTASVGCQQGVLIKALAANSGTVYVGGSTVSTTTGYPLAAGEEVFISIENLDDVYVIGSADNQSVAFLAY